MATLKEQADALRDALHLELVSPLDVDAWATAMVGRIEHPPFQLLSLATCAQWAKVDVDHALRSLEGDEHPRKSVQLTIGILAKRFNKRGVTLEGAVRRLFSYVLWCDRLSAEERAAVYALDDAYDHALTNTYCSFADVERDLRQFLAPYERAAHEISELP